MKKALRLALLASVALALPMAAAQTVHAQTYSRLISFGDSLSDNGNLFTATGNPPAPYNKRFTNDQVWAEYLSGSMQGWFTATSYTSGNLNLAWGGARSDSAANTNGPIPGTPSQIGYFQAHGGTFGANDVASLWIGANDIFQGLPIAASNPSTASTYMTGVASAAATNAVNQTAQLATLGAKTILVMNLPDLGNTPQFSADPTTASIATYSNTVFNTALDTGLKTVAASATGSNIIEVDIKSAFNAIIANPAAFGFTNVTQTCISQAACVTGSNDVKAKYLFWDGVHPTSGGHRIVAALTAQYLYTPTLTSGVGMLADEAYNTRRSTANDMAGLLHTADGKGGYFIQVVGGTAKRDTSVSMQSGIGAASTSSSQKAYDYSLAGVRAGAVQPMGEHTTIGFGVTAQTGDAQGFMVKAKPTDISLDVGLDWRNGPAFVTASLGGGFGQFSQYERSTLVTAFNEVSSPIDVSSYSASLQAGLDHNMGNWTFTPVARLSYAGGKMSAFSERGTVAAVAFEDRQVSALSGAIELQGAAKLSDVTALTGVIGYEAAISSSEDNLNGKLINNTAHAFSTDMGKVGTPGVLVGVGLQTHVMGMNLQAQYRGSFGSDSQTDQTAFIGLTKAF